MHHHLSFLRKITSLRLNKQTILIEMSKVLYSLNKDNYILISSKLQHSTALHTGYEIHLIHSVDDSAGIC